MERSITIYPISETGVLYPSVPPFGGNSDLSTSLGLWLRKYQWQLLVLTVVIIAIIIIIMLKKD